MRKLVAIVILATASAAHAETQNFGEVGAGFTRGYLPTVTAAVVEGSLGTLVSESDHDRRDGGAVHLLAAVGTEGFRQVRLGLRGMSCIGEGFGCAFVAVDVGSQRMSLPSGGDDSFVLVPAIGVELGPPFLRLRGALELPLYDGHSGIDEHFYEQLAFTGVVTWRWKL